MTDLPIKSSWTMQQWVRRPRKDRHQFRHSSQCCLRPARTCPASNRRRTPRRASTAPTRLTRSRPLPPDQSHLPRSPSTRRRSANRTAMSFPALAPSSIASRETRCGSFVEFCWSLDVSLFSCLSFFFRGDLECQLFNFC